MLFRWKILFDAQEQWTNKVCDKGFVIQTHREGEGQGQRNQGLLLSIYNPHHTEQKRAKQSCAEKKRESIYGNGSLLLSESSPAEIIAYEFWWFEFRHWHLEALHLKWGPDAKLQCSPSVMSKFWSTNFVTQSHFTNLSQSSIFGIPSQIPTPLRHKKLSIFNALFTLLRNLTVSVYL